MDVTRKNFTECLKSLQKVVKDASFLSIDGEFTGLDSPQLGQISPYDYPDERYQKIRTGSSDFLLIQFGLCAFRFIEDKQRYEVKSYNFYIFPRPYSRHAPDHRFLCQSSSLEFLASHGFDFNKVIREGISYLTPTQEASLRETLEKQHHTTMQFSSPLFTSPDGVNPVSSKGPVAIPDEQKDFVDSILRKISEFLEKNDGETLDLPVCTGFQRKLIYQSVRQKFKTGIHLQTKNGENKDRFIVCTRVSSEDHMKQKEAQKLEIEQLELEEAVGFTKVIRILSESCKLIIGHNMLLDLAHILHQFYYPLPPTYEDFKSMTRCAFPRLLDTKLMASTHPFKDKIFTTALGDLVKVLQGEPFKMPNVDISEGYTKYSVNSDQHHEAGFDAFITGMCFASMANYLGSFQQPPLATVQATSSLIEPFLNKVFLMRSPDIPYMDLAGVDLHPKRDHVFHITFPKEWKATDLYQLFSPFGNINISWVDDTSAVVSLYKKENASAVLKSLCQEGAAYTVTSFEKFKMADFSGENPHQQCPRKRSVPMVDLEVPSKKRRSLNVDAPPFQSRFITPIPEEMEEQEQNGGVVSSKNGGNQNGKEKEKTMEVDSSEKEAGKKNTKDKTSKSLEKTGKPTADKLFDEPPAW
ncbi:hypothetical protein ScPMuIL_003819 [Solemya velum]